MSQRVLVLHGPNLNLLGAREPSIYGEFTQQQLIDQVRTAAEPLGIEVELIQSNHEGALLDALHAAPERFDGVVFNPSALTHTSIALRDAVAAIPIPVVEVHLSNVHRREPYRAVSFVAERATATISGAGPDGYAAALVVLARRFAGTAR
ncbi:type II 3-dehydroquinate dehydratase [Leucobacter allii]|uniref:3-dehydroquinate dehydratase n=1 Tax=Leucobacter allii TaxID=2932247 RepID=A0ABY4FMI8_9MICO|nr:type II 3-dehydroquinate dehydratase [Leucobacter allii]UOQ57493.1 type II 3-dehydroquinate dehydratase [Leucobacter allii]UOR01953.1 type II 3-dehydroquinate dehydratase [Leucobacter allii]